MSVLGVVLRTRPEALPAVLQRLHATPGVEVGPSPGDGRVVLLLEDGDADAAATMAALAVWPEVLNVSLVYEYSGPDAPSPQGAVTDYRAWRGSLDRRAA